MALSSRLTFVPTSTITRLSLTSSHPNWLPHCTLMYTRPTDPSTAAAAALRPDVPAPLPPTPPPPAAAAAEARMPAELLYSPAAVLPPAAAAGAMAGEDGRDWGLRCDLLGTCAPLLLPLLPSPLGTQPPAPTPAPAAAAAMLGGPPAVTPAAAASAGCDSARPIDSMDGVMVVLQGGYAGLGLGPDPGLSKPW